MEEGWCSLQASSSKTPTITRVFVHEKQALPLLCLNHKAEREKGRRGEGSGNQRVPPLVHGTLRASHGPSHLPLDILQ